MRDMTPEEIAREIEQIRARHNQQPPGTLTMSEWNDIDFLLSIVKGQEADTKRDFDWALREIADGWIANNEREGEYGFYRNVQRVLGLISDDAAASMRSLCVEKVNEFDDWVWCKCSECRADARSHAVDCHASLSNLAKELESLTLQEQEAKQS